MPAVNIVTLSFQKLTHRLALPDGASVIMIRQSMENLDTVELVVEGVGPETRPGYQMAKLPIGELSNPREDQDWL